jgi:proteasome lid subunit RPN8/RPN11
LKARGNGVRESGAFLLGHIVNGKREASAFILYDDLEPGCLDTGVIRFTSVGYRTLWKRIKGTGLEVIADVHTHPEEAFFSGTDRTNPMMPTAGHMAFVLPDYAQQGTEPKDAAFFIYLGDHKWREFKPGRDSAQKLYSGFWS